MAGFFYKLGSLVGTNLRKANWFYRSLAGTEAEAIQAENAVGRDLARESLRQAATDPESQPLLDAISARLTACVTNPARQFCFRALSGSEINAYALPGGHVFVMRALLDFCRGDPDEIAFVLGHEMGHVLARHTLDRLMASSVISGALCRLPVGGVLAAPVACAANALLRQTYSQDQELEADSLGVRLAQCAGYDPRAAVELLNRLARVSVESPLLGYFSSHPPAHVRTEHLRRLLRPSSGV